MLKRAAVEPFHINVTGTFLVANWTMRIECYVGHAVLFRLLVFGYFVGRRCTQLRDKWEQHARNTGKREHHVLTRKTELEGCAQKNVTEQNSSVSAALRPWNFPQINEYHSAASHTASIVSGLSQASTLRGSPSSLSISRVTLTQPDNGDVIDGAEAASTRQNVPDMNWISKRVKVSAPESML